MTETFKPNFCPQCGSLYEDQIHETQTEDGRPAYYCYGCDILFNVVLEK